MASLDLKNALLVYYGDQELKHVYYGETMIWRKHNPIILSLSLTSDDILGRVGSPHKIVYSVDGDPAPDVSFTWEMDGVIINGAITDTYTPDTTGSLVGVVTVSNSEGSMTRRTDPVLIERFDILAILGQSNAVTNGISGSGGLPAGWAVSSRVKLLKNVASVWQWVDYNPATETNWGPEVAYAVKWLAANPTGTLGIVKRAVSGTQLGAISVYGKIQGASNKDWSFEPGMLYEESYNMFTTAKSLTPKAGLVDIIWLNGGSDARWANTRNDYFDNCSALFDAFRSDWGDCPIKLTTLSPYSANYDWEVFLEIQRELVDAYDDVYIGNVSTLPYQGDKLHLTAAGTNTSGGIFYDLGKTPLAITGAALSNSTVDWDAADGDVVGTLSAASYDASAPITWTIVGGSDQFVLDGSSLEVQHSANGAIVTEALTLRAATRETTVDINVTIQNNPWWSTSISAPYLDLDFENERYYYMGNTYTWEALEDANIASVVTFPSPVANGSPHIVLPGVMTNTYVFTAKVTNGVYNSGSANTVVGGTGAEYAVTIDDGDDGASTADNFVGWGRSAANNFRRFVSNGATTTWNATETGNANAADGTGPFGLAMRVKPQSFATAYSNADSGGSSTGSNGGATPQPVRLMIGNSGSGIREWTGSVHRVAVFNDRTNAQLRTEANFIAA